MKLKLQNQCSACPANCKSIFKASANHLVLTHLYKKGQVIFHEGTSSSGVYCLGEGVVKLCSTADDGSEVILRFAQAGDLLGHESLTGAKALKYSAVAVTDTPCCYFDQATFYEMLSAESTLLWTVLEKVEGELHESHEKNIQFVKKNVRERLAIYFSKMARLHGVESELGMKINLQLTRDEIASYIGTAHETAIRFISEFKASKLIKEEQKFFYIIDPVGISSLAGQKDA